MQERTRRCHDVAWTMVHSDGSKLSRLAVELLAPVVSDPVSCSTGMLKMSKPPDSTLSLNSLKLGNRMSLPPLQTGRE